MSSSKGKQDGEDDPGRRVKENDPTQQDGFDMFQRMVAGMQEEIFEKARIENAARVTSLQSHVADLIEESPLVSFWGSWWIMCWNVAR